MAETLKLDGTICSVGHPRPLRVGRSEINEALERLAANDVHYRFVIDMSRV